YVQGTSQDHEVGVRWREVRCSEARTRERKRHGPEDPPGTRAEVMRGLLHPRVAPRKRIGYELIREWKERDRLYAPHAVEPVDVRRLSEDAVADHPSSAEEKRVRGGDHERRREQRQ